MHKPHAVYGLLSIIIGTLGWSHPARTATYIVDNGQPRAQIVIAPERPRMVSLAALELQYYLQKISGARLPIVTEPAADVPVKIYVGQSAQTEKMGINAEGLKYGAYRMVSGPDWLVLLGSDFDYNPPKPYPSTRGAIPAAQAEWDEITSKSTDSGWQLPWRKAFKAWWNPREFDQIMGNRYGTNNLAVWNPKGLKWSRDYYEEGAGTGYWMHDDGGSLNAVCAFLRSLGVEWYMPGDLGEVIPATKTIALPDVNETVKPDFAMRSWFWYNYSGFPYDHIIWARRLGMNNSYEVLGNIEYAHGLVNIHGHKEMREKHPDYYALYGGVRDTEHRGHGTACHSSAELEKECVNFGRFMFDHYNAPHISLFPSDGFKICGCEKCQGKTPSELVWGFVDRIARELYKTHPDRIVSCGAYTSYVLPPDSIEQFTPNMMVVICNRGRERLGDPGRWEEYWSEIERWQKKIAPERLMRMDNNRSTLNNGNPVKFPALHPHAMAKDIAALNGICLGEYSEESQRKARWKAPGCDHLNLYVQSRFLWDADQDIETILNEYFKEFYGPVAAEMKTAFTDAEQDFNRLNLDTSTDPKNARINRLKAGVAFSERLHQAMAKDGPDTVYGQRIQFILDEMVPLADLKTELDTAINAPDPRQDAPIVVGRDVTSDKPKNTYTLNDIATGEPVTNPAIFTVSWDNGNLVFDITCQDNDIDNLFVTDDVYGGDSVAVLLETPTHSYYQIEVNPAGTLFDADREGKMNTRWASQATVKTEKGADFWRAIITIPVLPPEQNEGDPFHYVIGPKPSRDAMWYLNVCRARVRPDSRTGQAFMPTGGRTYHNRSKFAKLVIE